jgi:hypothetical protein
MTTPSVGRIVHYSDDQGTTCNAAIITAIIESQPGHVALRVFPGPETRRGLVDVDEWQHDVPYSATPQHVRTWHWPEGSTDSP